jgi:hypothetical protein
LHHQPIDRTGSDLLQHIDQHQMMPRWFQVPLDHHGRRERFEPRHPVRRGRTGDTVVSCRTPQRRVRT